MHNLRVDRMRATREDASDDIVELVEARWRDDDYTVDASVVVPSPVATRTAISAEPDPGSVVAPELSARISSLPE